MPPISTGQGVAMGDAVLVGGTGATPAILAALTLSSTRFTTGQATGTVLATISGKTAGSTISIAASDTSGVFAVNGAGTQLLTGLNYSSAAAASKTVALTETLSGAPNSPNTTSVGVTLAAGAALAAVLTTSDASTSVLSPTSIPTFAPTPSPTGQIVEVDTSQTYQSFVGVGAAITDAVAYTLMTNFSSAQSTAFLQEVFGTNGLSTCRICIGTSDFSYQPIYSYDDNGGVADPNLTNFSIANDLTYVIPVLKQILAINPNIKFFASPWSPPAWLKSGTSPTLKGGTFNATAANLTTYASYFVKFIQAYAAQGINVNYVSPQNEPYQNQNGYPSCAWAAADLVNFIGNYLAPAISAAGLSTKINSTDESWGDDASHGSFSAGVVANSTALAAIDGFQFHGYDGTPYQQNKNTSSLKTKNMHLTEFSVQSSVYTTPAKVLNKVAADLLVGSMRFGGSSVTLWNLVLQTGNTPCNYPTNESYRATCNVTTDGNATITRNPEYYALAHIGRYVVPGAVRLACTSADAGYATSVDLQTNAWKNPDGSVATFLYNPTGNAKTVSLRDVQSDTVTTFSVPAGAMMTVKYSGLAARTVSNSGTPWTPAQLVSTYGAANVAWADPTVSANLTQASGVVSSLANSGGYGGAFGQSTAAAKPKAETIGGYTFVGYDGKQYLSEPSMTHPAGPISYCVVASYTASRLNGTSFPTLFGLNNTSTAGFNGPSITASTVATTMGGNGYGTAADGAGTGQTNAPSSALVDQSPWASGNMQVVSGQLGPLNTNTKMAGVIADAQYNLTGTPASATGYLGLGDSVSTNGWAGDVGPFVLVRAAITPEEQEKLEGWAAWQCGQQATLAAGHPYRNAAPQV